MSKQTVGYGFVLVTCVMMMVSRIASAATLSDEEMSRVYGGGSEGKKCAYLSLNKPCLNMVEDVSQKGVGEECWRCAGGTTLNAQCKGIDDTSYKCKTKNVGNWCGSRRLSMVGERVIEGIPTHILYCIELTYPLPVAQQGCPGTGVSDTTRWCPQN